MMAVEKIEKNRLLVTVLHCILDGSTIIAKICLYPRCAGYLFQKVGKIAATAVGGGFLLLQVSQT